MAPSTLRPSTPPPYSLPLTPPPTSGYDHVHRRQTKTKEGESVVDFFKDFNEGSDTGIDVNDGDSNCSFAGSNNSWQLSAGESLTAETTISTASVASALALVDELDLLASPVVPSKASVVRSPFPFLRLPLFVRKKVYEHLLTIPGIICTRQKHTAFHDERKAFLYAEHRELLPGIAYALTQTKVDGPKSRFSRFPGTNINILRTSKEVFVEARAFMYSTNSFEIIKPSNELAPEPDFGVPLFPSGYQRLITKLTIRIRTFYGLDWLLSGGYNVLKNYYRGLSILTLVLEMDAATKGFGRQLTRKKDEKWAVYIKRLREVLAEDLFGDSKSEKGSVPIWIDLRVLFSGEPYYSMSYNLIDTTGVAVTSSMGIEKAKREELRHALAETWELFKKGGK